MQLDFQGVESRKEYRHIISIYVACVFLDVFGFFPVSMTEITPGPLQFWAPIRMRNQAKTRIFGPSMAPLAPPPRQPGRGELTELRSAFLTLLGQCTAAMQYIYCWL